MRILKFLGPTDVLEVEGKRIKRGKEETVSDGAAASLERSRQVQVEVRNLSAPRGMGRPRSGAEVGKKKSTPQGAATAVTKDKEKES